MKTDLTQGPIGTNLLKLAIPMTIGIMSVILFSLIDLWFISTLGKVHLNAISFVLPVTFLITNLAMGLGAGASSVISRAFGAGDTENSHKYLSHSIVLIMILAVSACSTCWFMREYLFGEMGANNIELELISSYLQYALIGLPFVMLAMVVNHGLRAFGNANLPAIVMLLFTGLNLILDPILIFGWFGLPAMGMAGAGLATAISYIGAGIVVLVILARQKMLCYDCSIAAITHSWGKILYIGVPSLFNSLLTPVSTLLLLSLLEDVNHDAVGAFGTATRIESLCIVVFMALSAALGPFVGQHLGAGKISRITEAFRKSIKFSAIWGAGTAIFFWLLAPYIVGIFSKDINVINIGTRYLYIIPISYAFLGVSMFITSSLNAAGRPFMSLSITFMRTFAILFPLIFLMRSQLELDAFFIAMLITNIIAGIYAWILAKNVF